MKNLLLVILFALTLSAQAAVSIISDLDDTIKITSGSGDPRDYLGDKVYTGMPDFFKAAKAYSNSLYILSASPTLMGPLIKKALKKHGVEYKSLILRANIREEKFTYKVKKIKEIMDANSDDFILVGDDLGQDPEAYAEIKRLYPSRILGTYIHAVNGRAISSDAVLYWTSFDLFLREHIAGRMDPKDIDLIATKLTTEINMDLIFPKKAQCPKTPMVYAWQLQTPFQQEALDLGYKFVKFCLVNRSVNILP